MVTDNHYRWDFIMLSTDVKPTPATSKKVTNGSTLYTSDDSKLYVWYKDQWYEKTATGGGGTSYTAGDGIVIDNDEISVDLAQTTGSSTTKVMSQKAITDFVSGLIKAGSAPTSSTEGTVGQLLEDTTNGKLYQLKSILQESSTEYTSSDPSILSVTNQTTFATWVENQGMSGVGTLIFIWYSSDEQWHAVDETYAEFTAPMSNADLANIGLSGNPPADSDVEATLTETTVTTSSYIWEEVGGSITPVQTTGTSTTDVMSQNATTSMVFADPSTTRKIQIGDSSSTVSSNGISIGYASSAGSSSAQNCVAIGSSAAISGGRIGSVALGANSGGNITKSGMVDIGSAFTSYGYEGNSNYRLLTGLYDPINAHDAATKGYVDGLVGGGGVKTLTSADINYPVDNPTGIALWKLEPGIYRKGESGLDVWFCSGSSQSQANQQVDGSWSQYQGLFIVRPGIWNDNPDSNLVDIMAFSSTLSSGYAYLQWGIDNSVQDGYYQGTTLRAALESEFAPLTGSGAPTASLPALVKYVGEFYIDTTNQDAYICVYKQSNANVWKKITP